MVVLSTELSVATDFSLFHTFYPSLLLAPLLLVEYLVPKFYTVQSKQDTVNYVHRDGIEPSITALAASRQIPV